MEETQIQYADGEPVSKVHKQRGKENWPAGDRLVAAEGEEGAELEYKAAASKRESGGTVLYPDSGGGHRNVSKC